MALTQREDEEDTALRRRQWAAVCREQRIRRAGRLAIASKIARATDDDELELRRAIKILVVDDDEAIRDTVTEILYEDGYWPIVAPNGVEALARLAEHRDNLPRLILLDLMMPIMDGWTFLEEMRKEPAYGAVPVIVISAHRREGRGRPIQPTEFLDKPFDLDQLVPLVEKYVGVLLPAGPTRNG